METNSYQAIKNYIYDILQKVEERLQTQKIEEEVERTKKLINDIGKDTFARVLRIDNLGHLSIDDWQRMKRELETEFNVDIERGILVQGLEQQKRHNYWWTSKEKQKVDGYYWKRYREYISKTLVSEVIKTLDDDTDSIMDNLADPMTENFSRLGMVVGHVQSGKTANYSGLICKAADAGYKFIVVIAGAMNNLRDQTQTRINESFVGRDHRGLIGVGKMPHLQLNRTPMALTTGDSDFNKRDADKLSQGMNFDNINSPVIIVIKKHSNSLKNVIKWIKSHYGGKVSEHSMLLIDDESDYASINTKTEENPAVINKLIRELLHLFTKSAYVAYTATPYANIFINHRANNEEVGDDLFPRDFIYALDAPTNYFGARKIFIDTYPKHIHFVDDFEDSFPESHKKNDDLSAIPESLYEAIRHFIINVAIRALRQQGNKHNSMLIHATRFTRMHQKISVYVYDYLNEVIKDVESFGMMPEHLRPKCLIDELQATFNKKYPASDFEWSNVLDRIVGTVNSIIVREVHKDSRIPLEYRNDNVTNAIVIGGTSLSRGFTLEGLSISYFLRSTIFYDTLMQMGRWFGYRIGYEDLCYLYMPESIAQNFSYIIEATEDLIDDLKRMAKSKRTPYDFGLAVRFHPECSLQVTAKNKSKDSKDTYIQMNLNGRAKETAWLRKEEEVNSTNLKLIVQLVNKLEQKYKEKYEGVGNNHLWRGIDKKEIIQFLNSFNLVPSSIFGLNARMPIDFIIKYAEEKDVLWDIALYSGRGDRPYSMGDIFINKESRQVFIKDGYYEVANRQVSSGDAETISLINDDEREQYKNDRKGARSSMTQPLLMLHIIDGKEVISRRENRVIDGISTEIVEKVPTGKVICDLAAFGVSFPGKVEDSDNSVIVKMNTVAIEQMLRQLEEEDEYDDE